ncbi:MAG: GHKL domain-containing protein [Syntrophomonadaceae bacterium]|nr:GHKL domain-containing protein [Syntrophomonadaceae bacterium]
MDTNRNLIVICTLLIQTLFIIIMNNAVLSTVEIETLKKFIPWVNLLVLAFAILNILSLKRMEEAAENRTREKLLLGHVRNVESLNNTLQLRQHEYSRHLQTIQAMAYLDKQKELKEYINGIAKKYRQAEDMIYAGHPAVTALINSRKMAAESQQIEFAVAVKCDLSSLNIPPWDINSILGNLIDNALEAAVFDDHPRVAVEFKFEDKEYLIYIRNNGKTIADPDIIFKPGFSTKDSRTRGYGLYSVKTIVQAYCGSIDIDCKNYTAIIVRLPYGGFMNDKYNIQESGSKVRRQIGC